MAKAHQEQVAGEHQYTPAYVSVQTFLAFVASLDPGGIPRSIDKSMMRSIAGGTQRKIMSALIFLGLIRPSGEVTETFSRLIQAYGNAEQRAAVLSEIVTSAYAAVIGEIDVATASAKQLNDAFRAAGVEGATLTDSVRFYIKLRREAGLPISRYIEAGKSKSNGFRAATPDAVAGRQQRQPRPKPKSNPPSPIGASDPPSDMIDFPIPLSINGAFIRVPRAITPREFPMVTAMYNAIEAMAKQNDTEN